MSYEQKVCSNTKRHGKDHMKYQFEQFINDAKYPVQFIQYRCYSAHFTKESLWRIVRAFGRADTLCGNSEMNRELLRVGPHKRSHAPRQRMSLVPLLSLTTLFNGSEHCSWFPTLVRWQKQMANQRDIKFLLLYKFVWNCNFIFLA
jgi:hypothetical protein